jgi:hypothetical protein
VDEQAPSIGPDEPLNRHAAAVRAELIATLPVATAVDIAFAIELRATFSETQQRPLTEEERYSGCRLVQRQPLYRLAGGRVDVDRRRIAGTPHGELTRANGRRVLRSAPSERAPRCRGHERPIVRDGDCRAERHDGDPNGGSAHGCDHDLGLSAGDDERLRLAQHRSDQRSEAELFQEVTTRDGLGHGAS